MTIGILRACAARHTAVTKSGNRLSTSTASTSATSLAASTGSTLPSFTPRLVAMVFSPSASSKISDTEAVPPSIRTAPLQSMPSALRSVTMRLLTWSSLPPSGPANATRPPRRAMAPAALAARQHGRDLRLGKPPRVFEFLAVDHNFAGQRLGMAADHQRGRERPRLRVEIDHAAAGDAGFLARFPPHRVLDRFARLDETGQARPHGRPETWGPAEQATLAVGRQHDHHRIGAREMLGLAGRAIAPPAGMHGLRRRAAVRAEAVAQMPVQHRLGLGDRRQMLGLDQPLHRDGTQVGDMQAVAGLQRLRRGRRNAVADAGNAVQ